MTYRGGVTMRRSRIFTSWINTLLLTVAVSFGVVSLSHNLSPVVTAGATTHAVVNPATGALASTPPVTVTYRGGDGSSSRFDR
jgi:hypothetical protein